MLAYLIPFCLKILPERGFLIFLLFFPEFSSRVEYERNLGLKFFSRFLGLSLFVLAKNNAGKWFFNILIFLLFFFGIFLPGSSMNGIRDKIFFSLSRPMICLKIMPERGFFLIFFLFFFNFLALVKYERNSRLKFFSRFLSLSLLVLAKNNVG